MLYKRSTEKLNNLFESKLLLNKYPYDVPDNTKHYIYGIRASP